MTTQQYSSAATSRPIIPTCFKKFRHFFVRGGINADIGGGKYELATEYLATLGVTNLVFDPENRSTEHNAAVLARIFSTPYRADTVTVANVLNVLREPSVRAQVLKLAAECLRPGGTGLIQIYEGDGSGHGRPTRGGSWQENRRASTYSIEVAQWFPSAQLRGATFQVHT